MKCDFLFNATLTAAVMGFLGQTQASEQDGRLHNEHPWEAVDQLEEQMAAIHVDELSQIVGDAEVDSSNNTPHNEWKRQFDSVLSQIRRDQRTVDHSAPMAVDKGDK